MSIEMLPKELEVSSKVFIPQNKPGVTTGRNSFAELRFGLKQGEKAVILEACPLYQHFIRKFGQESSHDNIISALKELAEKGQIMHDYAYFVRFFSQKFRYTAEKAHDIIRSADKIGLIHLTDRQFGNLKSINFISLKLDSLSLESLLWTLRSLKNDEMMPTERAIQSRMKEAFEFKPSALQWENLLDACKGFFKEKHQHTKSAPSERHAMSFSIFMHQQVDSEPLFRTDLIPEFSISEVIDPVTGNETHKIYPRGEE